MHWSCCVCVSESKQKVSYCLSQSYTPNLSCAELWLHQHSESKSTNISFISAMICAYEHMDFLAIIRLRPSGQSYFIVASWRCALFMYGMNLQFYSALILCVNIDSPFALEETPHSFAIGGLTFKRCVHTHTLTCKIFDISHTGIA